MDFRGNIYGGDECILKRIAAMKHLDGLKWYMLEF